jgi:muramoyltetrapeptide carboxypeptidase LdcA involved in peptidoglycan recycling
MKIGLVNLCKIEDFSKSKYYPKSLEFLKENEIDYIDYFSGRETSADLLSSFHAAVSNDQVELIWFVQGGNSLINFLDKIDWDLIKQSDKKFLGLSDFTHFAFKAVALGRICYYGSGLKQVKSYLPSVEQRQFLVDFLKKNQQPKYRAELLMGNGDANLENKKIIGGQSFISSIMLPHTNIALDERLLFFEHHYIPGEELTDANYFLSALQYLTANNKPLGIILGHSLLFGKDNNPLAIKDINAYFTQTLKDLGLPVYYINHFQTIIKLS